ncbi:MAG: hypothetical protein ACFCVE_07560 [Phycisphaerae bacterium]
MSDTDIETLLGRVNAMDRPELTRQLTQFDASFPIDFSDDFLAEQDEEKLRHLFAAICMHCNRLPELEAVGQG